jgi:hypothetical protein
MTRAAGTKRIVDRTSQGRAAINDNGLRPVEQDEERRYRVQLPAHCYRRDLPKMGETIGYVARSRDEWVAQVSVSAAALNCGVRNRWIGWNLRTQ